MKQQQFENNIKKNFFQLTIFSELFGISAIILLEHDILMQQKN